MSQLDPMRQIMNSIPVNPADQAQAANKPGKTNEAPANGEASFGDVMKGFVDQVDEAQKGFDQAIEAVERGDTDNLHQLMIAQSQAQLTLKLAAEVRNKMVEAYRETMRTQF